MKNKISKDIGIQIKELYDDKIPSTKIASLFNLNSSSIRDFLRRNNIKLRRQSEAQRKYKINEKYFDKINTQNKAYILGLLFADGCNYSKKSHVSLTLHDKDKKLLKKISKILQTNKPLRKVNNACALIIENKHISEQLNKLGMVPRKSLILNFPDCIHPKFYNHFIRGYFDGDGSIYFDGQIWRFSIISTEQFCNSIRKIFDQLNVKTYFYSAHKNNKNTFVLAMGKRKDILKVLDWLYDDAKICMERKYNNYLKLKGGI